MSARSGKSPNKCTGSIELLAAIWLLEMLSLACMDFEDQHGLVITFFFFITSPAIPLERSSLNHPLSDSFMIATATTFC